MEQLFRASNLDAAAKIKIERSRKFGGVSAADKRRNRSHKTLSRLAYGLDEAKLQAAAIRKISPGTKAADKWRRGRTVEEALHEIENDKGQDVEIIARTLRPSWAAGNLV